MAWPTLTETFDSMYSTTLAKRGKKVYDQVFRRTPLLYWLEKNERVTDEGGRYITRVLQLRENTAAKAFGRGEAFDQVDLDALTSAIFYWRNVGIPLTRYWDDEQQQMGDAEIINKVTTDIANTLNSLRKEIQGLLWQATPGSKEPYSLPYYVREDPTTSTSIAGVNQSTESKWRNQYRDSDAQGSAFAYLLPQMRDIALLAEDWGTIDYIICGSTAYSIYDDVALEQKRINDKRMGDAEFANIGWKGIPLVYDPNCTADNMYLLDSSTFEFLTHSGAYMKWTEWKKIPNQLDRVAQLVARLQLICTKRQPNCVIFDIAA